MSKLLSTSLFEKDKKRFLDIAELACSVQANYWGNSIIGENIFKVISSFANKKEIPLELLSYPFKDNELWAFTLKKKGTVFVCINSDLPVSKQVFSAAHELYHIYRYSEHMDEPDTGIESLLDSQTADEGAQTREDIEANAFAAILMMPENLLNDYIAMFNIAKDDPDVDDILTLMDIFGIPYKATVLRLYESKLINKTKATKLLAEPAETVEKRSSLTGKAKRWLRPAFGRENLGSLLDDFDFNRTHHLLTSTREAEDDIYIKEVMESFNKE